MDTGRYRCRYVAWGQGPPLICIPGMAGDAISFVMLMTRLQTHFRCISYDLPDGGQDTVRQVQLADRGPRFLTVPTDHTPPMDASDAPVLRRKVGRLLNDKMPTGVAVSPAMNHGGPYPATGHPGFTAVGIPAAITRFTALHCYNNVREERLPLFLRGE